MSCLKNIPYYGIIIRRLTSPIRLSHFCLNECIFRLQRSHHNCHNNWLFSGLINNINYVFLKISLYKMFRLNPFDGFYKDYIDNKYSFISFEVKKHRLPVYSFQNCGIETHCVFKFFNLYFMFWPSYIYIKE